MKIIIDGTDLPIEGRLRDGQLLAPLTGFVESLGAEVRPAGPGQTTICRGDLCVLLADDDVAQSDGVDHVVVDHLSDALDFDIRIDGDTAMVISKTGDHGLSPGDSPPEFALPDLFTGESVSSRAYLGRKVVFYMWASW